MTREEIIKRYYKYLSLRKRGLTFREIGDKYNISYQSVQYRVQKGLPSNYRNGNESKLEQFGFPTHSLGGRERTRMLVRIRDNFTCQDCKKVRTPEEVRKFNARFESLKGRKKLFDVHHLNGLCGKKSKDYDPVKNLSKLITLCHKCHYNRPEHKVKSKKWSKVRKKSY